MLQTWRILRKFDNEIGTLKSGLKPFIPDYTSSNKTIFDAEHVRIFVGISDADIRQLDVQILVDTMQGSTNREIIFQFHNNVFSDQRFEK